MPKPPEPVDIAPRSPGADEKSAASTEDPQQETVRTAEGLEFLHAGSGNTMGSGRTPSGGGDTTARDVPADASPASDAPRDG